MTNFQYDFETYNKVITSSALSKELIYGFMEQFMSEDNTFHMPMDEDDPQPGDLDFKMKAFNDELIGKKKDYKSKIAHNLNLFELESANRWKQIRSMEPEEIQGT